MRNTIILATILCTAFTLFIPPQVVLQTVGGPIGNCREKEAALDQIQLRGMLVDRVELSLAKLLRDREGMCAYAGWGADQVGR